MTEFLRLLRYLKPYAGIFAVSIVLMLLTGLLEGGTILLLQPIFDTITGFAGGSPLASWLRFLTPAGENSLQTIALSGLHTPQGSD